MSGLFDWLTEGNSPFGGGSSMPPLPQADNLPTQAMPPPQSMEMGPRPVGADGMPAPGSMGAPPLPPGGDPMTADQHQPQSLDPMTAGGSANPSGLPPPPPYPAGSDPMTAGGTPGNGPGLPYPPGTDPMTAGGTPGNGPGLPPAVPTPQPRPAGLTSTLPQPGSPMPLVPPPGNGTNGVGPGLGVGTQPNVANMPGQSFIGRALGITPEQGSRIGSGLSAGLKSVGENWNKPGLAAFSGSAGSAMEGSQKRADTQQTQAAKYLDSAIKSRQAGDEAGYKQNYLRYLAAKLQADTDKAASKDASANKNDTPTQLYLSAQRLVQPDRNAMNKRIEQMRKDGADPAEVTKAQADMETAISAKLNDHYATLGLHPQTAQQLAQQPGNARENPVDAGKMGITKDNIGQKLQPGQFYTNPSDGKVYQYKGPAKDDGAKKPAKGAIPDKPTEPEPANPSKPWRGSAPGSSGDSGDED